MSKQELCLMNPPINATLNIVNHFNHRAKIKHKVNSQYRNH